MTRFLRLSYFHLKLYAKNQYFFWMTIFSTLSVTMLQYLLAYSTHNLNDPQIWIRGGIFGLWSSATTATGVVGFQRFQGTLPYLINTKCGDVEAFLTLIIPASLFGLISFPLSFILCWLLGVNVTNLSIGICFNIILLWLGAFVLDLFIAGFFILTKNAIVYEVLVTLPILLLSGLFGYPGDFKYIYLVMRWLSPLTYPIYSLNNSNNSLIGLFAYVFSIVLWLVIANLLFKKIIFLSKKRGSIRII